MSIVSSIVGIFCPPAGIALSVLGKARSAIGGAVDWVFASATHLLIVACLILTAAALLEHRDAVKWHKASDLGMVAVKALETANTLAIQQATAAKEIKDAYNANLAAASDRTAADLSDRYRAVVLRLAAAQYSARHADLSGNADTTEGSDRSGESADVPAGPVNIPGDDALICADNTARLQAVHDWAVGMSDPMPIH